MKTLPKDINDNLFQEEKITLDTISVPNYQAVGQFKQYDKLASSMKSIIRSFFKYTAQGLSDIPEYEFSRSPELTEEIFTLTKDARLRLLQRTEEFWGRDAERSNLVTKAEDSNLTIIVLFCEILSHEVKQLKQRLREDILQNYSPFSISYSDANSFEVGVEILKKRLMKKVGFALTISCDESKESDTGKEDIKKVNRKIDSLCYLMTSEKTGYLKDKVVRQDFALFLEKLTTALEESLVNLSAKDRDENFCAFRKEQLKEIEDMLNTQTLIHWIKKGSFSKNEQVEEAGETRKQPSSPSSFCYTFLHPKQEAFSKVARVYVTSLLASATSISLLYHFRHRITAKRLGCAITSLTCAYLLFLAVKYRVPEAKSKYLLSKYDCIRENFENTPNT